MKKRLRKKVLEELSEIPNVSLVCKRLNVSRQTFYRWMREDIEFKAQIDEAMDEGIQSMCDLAESKLIENIKSGNQKAIEYCLSNNSKRYLRPKPLILERHNITTELTEERKKKLMDLIGS